MTEPKKKKAIQANNLLYNCCSLHEFDMQKNYCIYLTFMKGIRTTTLACEGAWYKHNCWINDHYS